MTSIKTMLRQCIALCDTKDLSLWEDSFLKSVWEKSYDSANTTCLSEKQVAAIEKIWKKHFA